VSLLDVILPWRTAQRLHKIPNSGRDEDATFDRLGFWRSACGLVTVAAVGLSFGKSLYATVIGNGGSDLAVNASIGIGAMVLCVAGIYLITRREHRSALHEGTKQMLRNMGILCLTAVAPALAIPPLRSVYHDFPLSLPILMLVCGPLGCAYLMDLADRRRLGARRGRFLLYVMTGTVVALVALSTVGIKEGDRVANLAVVLVAGPAALWWLLYLVFLCYWMARTVMWAGAVHPMLAPIGVMLIVVAAFANKVTYYRADDVPFTVWLTMSLCGLVATCALGVAEIRALSRRGVSLRNGPEPTIAA